jgi:hypothetical protein
LISIGYFILKKKQREFHKQWDTLLIGCAIFVGKSILSRNKDIYGNNLLVFSLEIVDDIEPIHDICCWFDSLGDCGRWFVRHWSLIKDVLDH